MPSTWFEGAFTQNVGKHFVRMCSDSRWACAPSCLQACLTIGRTCHRDQSLQSQTQNRVTIESSRSSYKLVSRRGPGVLFLFSGDACLCLFWVGGSYGTTWFPSLISIFIWTYILLWVFITLLFLAIRFQTFWFCSQTSCNLNCIGNGCVWEPTGSSRGVFIEVFTAKAKSLKVTSIPAEHHILSFGKEDRRFAGVFVHTWSSRGVDGKRWREINFPSAFKLLKRPVRGGLCASLCNPEQIWETRGAKTAKPLLQLWLIDIREPILL